MSVPASDLSITGAAAVSPMPLTRADSTGLGLSLIPRIISELFEKYRYFSASCVDENLDLICQAITEGANLKENYEGEDLFITLIKNFYLSGSMIRQLPESLVKLWKTILDQIIQDHYNNISTTRTIEGFSFRTEGIHYQIMLKYFLDLENNKTITLPPNYNWAISTFMDRKTNFDDNGYNKDMLCRLSLKFSYNADTFLPLPCLFSKDESSSSDHSVGIVLQRYKDHPFVYLAYVNLGRELQDRHLPGISIYRCAINSPSFHIMIDSILGMAYNSWLSSTPESNFVDILDELSVSHKTPLEKFLYVNLAAQTIGNCSWVSNLGMIRTFYILENTVKKELSLDEAVRIPTIEMKNFKALAPLAPFDTQIQLGQAPSLAPFLPALETPAASSASAESIYDKFLNMANYFLKNNQIDTEQLSNIKDTLTFVRALNQDFALHGKKIDEIYRSSLDQEKVYKPSDISEGGSGFSQGSLRDLCFHIGNYNPFILSNKWSWTQDLKKAIETLEHSLLLMFNAVKNNEFYSLLLLNNHGWDNGCLEKRISFLSDFCLKKIPEFESKGFSAEILMGTTNTLLRLNKQEITAQSIIDFIQKNYALLKKEADFQIKLNCLLEANRLSDPEKDQNEHYLPFPKRTKKMRFPCPRLDERTIPLLPQPPAKEIAAFEAANLQGSVVPLPVRPSPKRVIPPTAPRLGPVQRLFFTPPPGEALPPPVYATQNPDTPNMDELPTFNPLLMRQQKRTLDQKQDLETPPDAAHMIIQADTDGQEEQPSKKSKNNRY
ncbi:MAG: hypothetical protein ACKOAD_08925 [Gammaproteobacteria bacterium]